MERYHLFVWMNVRVFLDKNRKIRNDSLREQDHVFSKMISIRNNKNEKNVELCYFDKFFEL